MRWILGFLLGFGVALIFCATTVHAAEPCQIVFLVDSGNVLALPAPWCPEPWPKMRMTKTAIEIDNDGQIIVLRLPSGWGSAGVVHLVTYILGDGTYLLDGAIQQISVKGW